jgi:hypothetical protein
MNHTTLARGAWLTLKWGAVLLPVMLVVSALLTNCSLAKPPDARGRVLDIEGKPLEGVHIVGARKWTFTGYNRTGDGCDLEHVTRTDVNGEFVIPGEKLVERKNWNPLSTNYGSGYAVGAYKKGMRERYFMVYGARKEPVPPYTFEIDFEVDPTVSAERYNTLAGLSMTGCSCSEFHSAIKEEMKEIEVTYPRKDRPRDHYAVSKC